jgi:4-hydroxy-tetrahydrodipicolinate synthase
MVILILGYLQNNVPGCSKVMWGLAVFGTNSEGNSFSAKQKINALEYLVSHGLAADQIMPGTGACSVDDAVTMTKATIHLGCSGASMLPPFYYKDPAEDGLFAYYAQIIEKIGSDRLKIYVYNIPPVVKFGIPVSLLERLTTAYPNTVVGMKDSSGDWGVHKVLPEMLLLVKGLEFMPVVKVSC